MRPWYSSVTRTDLAAVPQRSGWLAALCLLTASLVLAPLALAQPGSLFSSQPRFLEVDEAFRYYTSLDSDQQISIHWTIAPGYYLYRDKFEFQVIAPNGEQFGVTAEIPAGIDHHDEFFGDVEVHYDALRTVIPLPDAYRESFELIVGFQGCAEAGLCYLPQRQRLEIYP